MEFDNDRIVKRAYKIELFYLALLILINPLVNSITFFLVDFRIWPVLLLVNLALFPAYVLYSRFIVAKFLFQKKYVWFIPATITFFCLVLMLILGGYSIILNFPLLETEKNYFFVSYPTIIREGVWIVVNMALATAVSFIKEALDEKDMLSVLQKDNTFYKLRYLRAQLNPHFLFNTLNSIYS